MDLKSSNSEVVSLEHADCYYVEALTRIKRANSRRLNLIRTRLLINHIRYHVFKGRGKVQPLDDGGHLNDGLHLLQGPIQYCI